VEVTVEKLGGQGNSGFKSDPWCWTRAVEDIKQEDQKLGINWGLCMDPKNHAQLMADYVVTVHMPFLKGYTGKSGPFFMSIDGEYGEGQEFVLKEKAFEKGERFELSLKTVAVGEIKQIRLRMDNADSGKFACNYIEVAQGPSTMSFPCDGVLDQDQRTMELESPEQTFYEINMVPADDKGFATDQPVFIQLIGTKGLTSLSLLTEHGTTKAVKKARLYLKDIEDLMCIKVTIMEDKPLKVKNLDVTTIGNDKANRSTIKFNTNQIMRCGEMCSAVFCKDENALKSVQNDESAEFSNNDIKNVIDSMQKANTNNNGLFNGGQLDPQDQYLVRTVSCKTTGAEVFADYADYQEDGFNYEMKMVKCPADCNNNAIIIGLGQHPQSTPVCAAAIVDGAMPVYGGIVAVNKYNGAQGFDAAVDLVHGVTVKKGVLEKVQNVGVFSFSTSKVDNVDFMASNLRILNHLGEPDYMGRVEMRINGQWGTFSQVGSHNSFAKKVCETLGYEAGDMMNSTSENISCENFKNNNYCGNDSIPVHN